MQKLHDDPHPVELLVLAGLLLAEAMLTVLRLLVVPLLAVLFTLAGWRPGPRAAGPEAPPEPPAAAAEPAAVPCLATIADDLMQLPAARLRALAGTRRRMPKAQLVAAILAMPV